MKKKEIKEYFTAIRNNDIEKVKTLVSNDKTYLIACNFAPPKKDDGQSGLQVAFKTGKFDIAEFLIEQGIDVSFIEKSDINVWKAPVLHDCITAVIFNCLANQKDVEIFNKALSLLKIMLKKGADPNALDSYGNTCLGRAILDAKIMKNQYKCDIIGMEQIREVFKALIDAGADVNFSDGRRENAVDDYKTSGLQEYKLF